MLHHGIIGSTYVTLRSIFAFCYGKLRVFHGKTYMCRYDMFSECPIPCNFAFNPQCSLAPYIMTTFMLHRFRRFAIRSRIKTRYFLQGDENQNCFYRKTLRIRLNEKKGGV